MSSAKLAELTALQEKFTAAIMELASADDALDEANRVRTATQNDHRKLWGQVEQLRTDLANMISDVMGEAP